MKEKSKTVNMGAKTEKSDKLTYEQLEQVAGNLNQQCQQLHTQLMRAQNTIAEFNEIGMLLDILAKSEHFSEKFITRCSSKIEEVVSKAMDVSEQKPEETAKNN